MTQYQERGLLSGTGGLKRKGVSQKVLKDRRLTVGMIANELDMRCYWFGQLLQKILE